jgi:hypothetical protein
VFDRDGQPLILDWNNLRLRRINQDGTVSTIMGNGFEALPTEGALAIDTPLHHASDIKFDAAGRLYVPAIMSRSSSASTPINASTRWPAIA